MTCCATRACFYSVGALVLTVAAGCVRSGFWGPVSGGDQALGPSDTGWHSTLDARAEAAAVDRAVHDALPPLRDSSVETLALDAVSDSASPLADSSPVDSAQPRDGSAADGAVDAALDAQTAEDAGLLVQTHCANAGQQFTDVAGDVMPAHVDVLKVTTSLNQRTLQAVFQLRDLPDVLDFNRANVSPIEVEYAWAILIDTNGNPDTGYTTAYFLGAEYELSATRWGGSPPFSGPIEGNVQASVWRLTEAGSRSVDADATLSVDSLANTITLTGDVRGISGSSRLFFVARDANPGQTPEVDYCDQP